jgi:hypothetical protein
MSASVFLSPALISIAAILYAASFLINSYVMGSFSFSLGVSWVFLPAGLRLLLTLLLDKNGALGIAIASIAISLGFYFEDPVLGIGAGIISGLAPYIATLLVFSDKDSNRDLSQLDAKQLLNCVFVFSVVSPLMHQAWFSLNNKDGLFFEHLGVMIIGDLIGTLIVIYLAKAAIYLYKRRVFNQKA